MCKAALLVAGCIFSVVSIVHLVRLLKPFPIVIGSFSVPESFSLVGFVVAGALALWMFFSSWQI